ncbi:MAG: Smr/MutS family protein [Proteobacteria bacterium]|nr:Smr/MutS family protein [Pseudomonadota bacterium]
MADVVRQPAAATVPRRPSARPSREGFAGPAARVLPSAVARPEALGPGHGEGAAALEAHAIEGSAAGIDPRWLRRLRRGEVPVEGRLDLHGATRQEAKDRVERFVLASRRRGLRCVLLVHGRGLHSLDGWPVLKEELKTWLLQGTLGACTMAFCSAQGRDGGLGATYVLLRRAPTPCS